MNNRFKFRIWHKKQNKFIDPSKYEHLDYYKTTGLCLIDCSGNLRVADYPSGNGDNSASSVFTEINKEDYIIQQYTGCHDSSSKEIYEGDIIKYNDGNSIRIGYIGFMAGIFFLNYLDENDDELGYLLVSNITIIGNTMENPELLK